MPLIQIEGKMAPKAFVFFSKGGRRHRIGLRRRTRIARRFPRRSIVNLIDIAVRTLTGSELIHCSIGFDGGVLDPRIGGDSFWPILNYIDDYPGLAWVVMVTLERSIDLDDISIPGPKPVLPSLIRWTVFGLAPAPEDCVSTVSRALRAGGICVPKRIVSPKQLLRWLIQQEYPHSGID